MLEFHAAGLDLPQIETLLPQQRKRHVVWLTTTARRLTFVTGKRLVSGMPSGLAKKGEDGFGISRTVPRPLSCATSVVLP